MATYCNVFKILLIYQCSEMFMNKQYHSEANRKVKINQKQVDSSLSVGNQNVRKRICESETV